jgi:hypothetical protein
MADTSLIYYNDQLAKVVPRLLRLEYKITGAVTASPVVSNSASLITFSAISAQATIDDFLGSTTEFNYLAFDATSMGADTMGGIVNMGGQVKSVTQMVAYCYSASNTIVTRQCRNTGLTATTIETALALGTSGNVAFKVDWGNTPDFDALTAGTIVIDIGWISK